MGKRGKSAKPVNQPKPSNSNKVKRFVFCIPKDIKLLRKCLENNPWQLGKEKWTIICSELTEEFGCELKERTAKERVENLLIQHEKQEFAFKTGTEEEKSERGELLDEIRAIKEQELVPINCVIGPDADVDPLEHNVVDSLASQTSQIFDPIGVVVGVGSSQTYKLNEVVQDQKIADHQRDEALKNISGDTPPECDTFRRKRTRVAMEEDMIFKKQRHDMEIEQRKLSMDQEEKNKHFNLEQKRLEIELMKENRLADEGRRRDELLGTMCGLLTSFQKFVDKRSE